jgi:Kef-type K+ transport system membrane component KefB
MRAGLSLLTLLLLGAFLHGMAPNLPSIAHQESAMTVVSVALLLLGAWLAGILAQRVGLPKICGYLAAGILLGPELLNLVPAAQIKAAGEQVAPLKFINDIAVALIALLAGGEIRLGWLRERARSMTLLLVCETAITLALLAGIVFAAGPLIPFMTDASLNERWVIALLAGVVMISNSPAVIIAMLSEYRARGPLAQTMLGFAVCKDLILIVLFAASLSIGRGVLSGSGISGSFVAGVAVQLFGSVGIGCVLGVVMAWYVHRVQAHLMVFLLGFCLLFAFVGELYFTVAGNRIHFETLLMALTAGLLCQNLWPRESEPMFHHLEEMSLPVYCLFFAFAGAKIESEALQALWYVSLGLVVCRAAGIWLGMKVGTKVAGLSGDWPRYLWLGMIPQAGVSLVLVTLISRTFDQLPGVDWGPALASMLVGMIVVHETLGPIGLKQALVRSGEADPEADREAEAASETGGASPAIIDSPLREPEGGSR